MRNPDHRDRCPICFFRGEGNALRTYRFHSGSHASCVHRKLLRIGHVKRKMTRALSATRKLDVHGWRTLRPGAIRLSVAVVYLISVPPVLRSRLSRIDAGTPAGRLHRARWQPSHLQAAADLRRHGMRRRRPCRFHAFTDFSGHVRMRSSCRNHVFRADFG